jgi:hypothetical protein
VRLRLRFCVASDTRGRLIGIGWSHGGTALLGCGVLVLLLASETAEDEEADECETDDGPDNCSSNPSFGATTAAVAIVVVCAE